MENGRWKMGDMSALLVAPVFSDWREKEIAKRTQGTRAGDDDDVGGWHNCVLMQIYTERSTDIYKITECLPYIPRLSHCAVFPPLIAQCSDAVTLATLATSNIKHCRSDRRDACSP